MMLANLGADVIRVETSKRTCLSRRNPPFADNVPGPNRAGVFNEWNQNKRSIQLNLAKPEGIEIARRLAEKCDIAIENFGAGVMDRMGLGYEVLRRHNPGIIMLSIGCYGRTGPYTDFVNYGPQVNGQAGLLAVSGYEGDQIREGPCAYGDPATGVFAAFLINAALLQRRRTGAGQYFELSMMEVLAMGLPEALLEYAMNGRDLGPSGNHDRWMAPHNCYKALGGAEDWVTIAVGTRGRMAPAVRCNRTTCPRRRCTILNRRAAQTQRTGAGPDHHRMDLKPRSMGNGKDAAKRRRRRHPHPDGEGSL